MKSSYSQKKNRFLITMSILSVIACIMTSASYKSGVSSIAASALGFAVMPVQHLVSGTHDFFRSKAIYFKNMDKLKAENAELKSEVKELTRKVSELEPIKEENDMLYNFLGLKKERNDISFVNAEIISRAASNYTADFTIDKGSIHGIKKDMAVVTSDNSLLGIIVEVGATYSRGKVLTSYDLRVGVKNERTGEPGILTGNFELSRKDLCEISDLPDSSDCQKGDIIRTSGLGDIYPSGIYIGSVKEIVPNPLNYTVSAVVTPASSVFNTDAVMVITDFDRTYELQKSNDAALTQDPVAVPLPEDTVPQAN